MKLKIGLRKARLTQSQNIIIRLLQSVRRCLRRLFGRLRRQTICNMMQLCESFSIKKSGEQQFCVVFRWFVFLCGKQDTTKMQQENIWQSEETSISHTETQTDPNYPKQYFQMQEHNSTALFRKVKREKEDTKKIAAGMKWMKGKNGGLYAQQNKIPIPKGSRND